MRDHDLTGKDKHKSSILFSTYAKKRSAFCILNFTASYIALKKNKAVAGFKDWLKVVFDFKHGFFAYALAILLPILHLILTCMICGYEKGSPIYMLITLIPAMIVITIREKLNYFFIRISGISLFCQ